MTTPMTKDNAKESVESITEEVYEKARNKKARKHDSGPSDHDKLEDAQVTRYRALVARANYLAVDRHRDRTGKGFRGWRGTCDTRLDAYSGMQIKAHPASSLASPTATGPDAKEHVDPHPVDAWCGGRTLSRCGAGRKHW